MHDLGENRHRSLSFVGAGAFCLGRIFSTFGGLVLSPGEKSQRMIGNILIALERTEEEV